MMAKHRKMMKNKCPEQTLQIKIQYCIQLRSSLATVVWNMSHILLSLFSCNCKSRTCRCVLWCLGEQCIKWWKGTKFKLCGGSKRSLHNRSSPTGYSAWDQGKHQGYPLWVAEWHESKRAGQIEHQAGAQDVNQAGQKQLWGADD